MSTTFTLTPAEQVRLAALVDAALTHVTAALTEMFGADVAVTAVHIRTVPLSEAGGLIGSPDLEVAAVYLGAAGELPGHLLLLMPLDAALALCDVLLEQPPGTTTALGEMEASALGEVGNIVGSFFLSSLADRSGLRMQVTPPGVFCDMAGAVISLALVEVAMYADEVIVIDAGFIHQGRHLPAWFLAFPDPSHLATVLARGGAV
jgi:chemotaxis protein CheC